jgi:apolipoprotein N-acyltransferase
MLKSKTYVSFFYFLIGFGFLFFFNGRWILPIAAFLAPIFLIRFLRTQNPLGGFLLLILAGWISNIFIWQSMMPVSGFFYYILMLMMSLFTSITFLLDRLYSQKWPGILSTLVFPAAYATMDFIVTLTNPSGSYGTLVHTQTSLPLLQLISLTGIWGVTFLITWTSSLTNWLWDHSFEKNKMRLGFFVYGIPVILILIFGQIRLAVNHQGNTVRIAAINISKASFNNQTPLEFEKTNTEFLTQCHIAANSGAKIVFGIETLIKLSYNQENKYLEKAKAIAQSDNIYVGLPMLIFPEGFPQVRPMNKITWISPQGQVLLTYFKEMPTPGEGNYGEGRIKYFDSPFGRIGSVICFDMDFPSYIQQVNKMNIDIMLVPGNDWREISPYNTYVSSIRAIEQGFNMVRAASQGLSAAFNDKGYLLSSLDYFKTDDLILYSDVPTQGQKTLYSIFGDYFAWLCILFLITTSAIVIKKALTHRPDGHS